MTATRRSVVRPPRSLLDAYRFVRLTTAAGGVRIAEIIGYRKLTRRRTGVTERGFVIRVWKSTKRRWDTTTGFILDDHALNFATLDDLVRVGLVTLNNHGEWI